VVAPELPVAGKPCYHLTLTRGDELTPIKVEGYGKEACMGIWSGLRWPAHNTGLFRILAIASVIA